MVPKVIYSLWNTGRETMPPVVRMAEASWRRHAPDYELRVFDGTELNTQIRELGLQDRKLTIQAASDILRTKLLFENGGYWLDATCLLTAALDGWAPQLSGPSGFFAFARPGEDRLISSWFLAAAPGNPILGSLLGQLVDYWSVDREMYAGRGSLSPFDIRGRRDRKRALRDPIWAVSPDGYARSRFAPYYFFHYLFAWNVRNDAEAGAIWRDTPKISAVPAHGVGEAFGNGDFGDLDRRSVEQLLRASPIHKLNWRLDFPASFFEIAETL